MHKPIQFGLSNIANKPGLKKTNHSYLVAYIQRHVKSFDAIVKRIF
ncbi:MAG: hypothetical protein JSC161_000184 [Candidatus Tokpelaia sp. JSC161]|nr:MAG: hypothetical protein JSC161_000184 [Candidatus Tokpelaia sp. JSC161]